jgi:hypothetical protein
VTRHYHPRQIKGNTDLSGMATGAGLLTLE